MLHLLASLNVSERGTGLSSYVSWSQPTQRMLLSWSYPSRVAIGLDPQTTTALTGEILQLEKHPGHAAASSPLPLAFPEPIIGNQLCRGITACKTGKHNVTLRMQIPTTPAKTSVLSHWMLTASERPRPASRRLVKPENATHSRACDSNASCRRTSSQLMTGTSVC